MTQTVPDISPLMPMHQNPLLVTVITALLLQGRNMAVMAFQITGPSTGSGNGLAPNRRQAIT